MKFVPIIPMSGIIDQEREPKIIKRKGKAIITES
jgi:hypothetical protein